MAKKRKPQPKIKTLKVVKLTKKALKDLDINDEPPGWFVSDPNNLECPFIGCYDTKVEANEARIGMQKFWTSNTYLLTEDPSND